MRFILWAAFCAFSCPLPVLSTCSDTLRLIDVVERENEHLLATDMGILRLDKRSGQIDRGYVSVGSNQIDQIVDNGRGFLLSVWDGCGFDVTTPCGIYQVSYDLKEVKRVATTPIRYRNADILHSRFDSVFVSLTNGGAYVSHDFMKTWSYVQSGPGSGCSMGEMTWDHLAYGETLYLANASGLFAYRGFADHADNLFCNQPGHNSGEILRYDDSVLVSDSGYVYRIAKLGENAWRRFPLPPHVSMFTCRKDIFSRYMVSKDQKNGCGGSDSIRIEVFDLKQRQTVANFSSTEYRHPIDYAATQDKLFVTLGRSGIAVYDRNLVKTVFTHQDCASTGLVKAGSGVEPSGRPSLLGHAVNGRKVKVRGHREVRPGTAK